jgi:hypothetical protein
MGNCMSTHTPSLSDSLETLVGPDTPNSGILCPTTTHIIVHRAGESFDHLPGESPPSNLWLFEYCLNLGPVCIGQHVILHLRAEDCYNPDPALQPVAEGWITRVTGRTPHWLTFQILDKDGGEPALLNVPYVHSA